MFAPPAAAEAPLGALLSLLRLIDAAPQDHHVVLWCVCVCILYKRRACLYKLGVISESLIRVTSPEAAAAHRRRPRSSGVGISELCHATRIYPSHATPQSSIFSESLRIIYPSRLMRVNHFSLERLQVPSSEVVTRLVASRIRVSIRVSSESLSESFSAGWRTGRPSPATAVAAT